MTPEEQAKHLEACVVALQRYVRVLRGQEEDGTGRGLLAIACGHLEIALDVEVVGKEELLAVMRRLGEVAS